MGAQRAVQPWDRVVVLTAQRPVRVVALSDTHAMHDHVEVPPGDVLVHAGDLTRVGSLEDVEAFGRWLARLPHRHKVVIAGNHDFCFEREARAQAIAALGDVVYLQDAAAHVAGLRMYGSPWQPEFHDWAFNLPRGEALARVWAKIPKGLDVLLTHGPPHGVGDVLWSGDRAGCEALAEALPRARPQVHVFGHIHEAYGVYPTPHALCLNASVCTFDYAPTQRPRVVDIWPGGAQPPRLIV